MDKQEKYLEDLLQKAANEPAYRPVFLEKLLNGHVYCLGTTDTQQHNRHGLVELQQGDHIYLRKWQNHEGRSIVPFFLSVDSLSKAIEQQESYLRLSTRELFDITLGDHLMLNPNLPYGKEFIPEEINSLLQQGSVGATEQFVAEEDIQVLLGQPSQYPDQMVEQLNKFFQQHSEIEKAYLALMHNPARDEKPVLVVGVLFNIAERNQTLMNQIGQVAYDSLGEIVDIFMIDPQESSGLSGYMFETEPFYHRQMKKRGFFAQFFSKK